MNTLMEHNAVTMTLTSRSNSILNIITLSRPSLLDQIKKCSILNIITPLDPHF